MDSLIKNEKLYISPSRAAKLLSVSIKKLRALKESGVIKNSIKVRNEYYFASDEIRELAKENGTFKSKIEIEIDNLKNKVSEILERVDDISEELNNLKISSDNKNLVSNLELLQEVYIDYENLYYITQSCEVDLDFKRFAEFIKNLRDKINFTGTIWTYCSESISINHKLEKIVLGTGLSIRHPKKSGLKNAADFEIVSSIAYNSARNHNYEVFIFTNDLPLVNSLIGYCKLTVIGHSFMYSSKNREYLHNSGVSFIEVDPMLNLTKEQIKLGEKNLLNTSLHIANDMNSLRRVDSSIITNRKKFKSIIEETILSLHNKFSEKHFYTGVILDSMVHQLYESRYEIFRDCLNLNRIDNKEFLKSLIYNYINDNKEFKSKFSLVVETVKGEDKILIKVLR